MADTIVVASSVYNLAGGPTGRPDFLKSLIIGRVSQPEGPSVGGAIVKGFPTSMTHKIRRFLRWSHNDSSFQEDIGLTSGTLPGAQALNQTVIRDNMVVESGYTLGSLLSTTISKGQVSYWVAQYMVKYHWGYGYTYTYTPSSNTATITMYPDGEVFTLNPVDFDQDELYLYVKYVTTTDHVFWYIYHRGTGIPALDALFEPVTPELIGSFYPPIPFRFNNNPVSADSPDTALVSIYPTCKKAFKKAFGADFDDVQKKILDNPSIANIDHIYAVLAVSLNTGNNAAQKYIYRFFDYLRTHTDNHTLEGENTWLSHWEDGTSRPSPPWKHLQVESVRTGTSDYRTDIKWAFMHEVTGTGKALPWMRKGDFVFQLGGNPLSTVYTEDDGFNQRVFLWWQETSDSWRRLVITGLQYNNYVYAPQYTRVTATQAIGLTGKDSEFLVPLHDVLYRELPLVDALQIGTSCSFLVFNCYEVHKEEWYESDWFKVVLVVVIIVVSIVAAIFTGGGSLGAGGAAIAGVLAGAGLSTAAALVLAAAAEALAGILISFLISEVAVALFGEKWGPLIGAIVSFIFSFGMSAGSANEIITALTRPDTWIALASATGGGVAAYMQAEARSIAADTAKMMEEYSAKTAEVQRMYEELQSGGRGEIDLSVVNRYILETSEKPGDFLKRTLATGSDIVEITLGQIESFSQINLKLVLP